MIRLWCFDLDGTLVDSAGDLTAAVNVMRGARSLPPMDREQVIALLGCGRRKLVSAALADAAVSEAELDDLEQLYGAFYAAHSCELTRLFPGVEETLRRLKSRGCRIALATNKTASDARSILHRLGVAGLFDRVLGDGDGCALKPAPDMILALMREFAAAPEETAMVGDNHTDLGAAARAGVMAVFASYGYGSAQAERVDRAIENFAELETLS